MIPKNAKINPIQEKLARLKLNRISDESAIELTDEVKPDIFEKGLKPIIQKTVKQQFNDDSNKALYGLIQLLIEKQVITNDEYLEYCLEGIQVSKQTKTQTTKQRKGE